MCWTWFDLWTFAACVFFFFSYLLCLFHSTLLHWLLLLNKLPLRGSNYGPSNPSWMNRRVMREDLVLTREIRQNWCVGQQQQMLDVITFIIIIFLHKEKSALPHSPHWVTHLDKTRQIVLSHLSILYMKWWMSKLCHCWKYLNWKRQRTPSTYSGTILQKYNSLWPWSSSNEGTQRELICKIAHWKKKKDLIKPSAALFAGKQNGTSDEELQPVWPAINGMRPKLIQSLRAIFPPQEALSLKCSHVCVQPDKSCLLLCSLAIIVFFCAAALEMTATQNCGQD